MAEPDTASHTDHRRCADTLAQQQPVHCAVLTISDTRTAETDQTGPRIRELLEAGRHVVEAHAIVRDDVAEIDRALRHWIVDPSIHAIITTGGTGFARRDSTIGVVNELIDVPLEGFGELFRMISYQDVGSAAMLSRAVAGLVHDEAGGDTFLFALPGSRNAVEIAMTRLIGPELAHLVMHRRT